MTAPEMDPRTGLLPDQAWSVPSGPRWQARLWADGRHHVIGELLATHEAYGLAYYLGEPGYAWTTFENALLTARRNNEAARRRGGE